MNRKTLVRVLIAEAVLLAALCVLTLLVPSVFSSMLAFPFEQIALGAGAFSRLGSVGNGFAVALLTGLSLIPLFAAFRYPRGKETVPERCALVALSAVLFAAFYGILCPGAFRSVIPGDAGDYIRVMRGIFGITVWTVVILFVVLRLIRLIRAGNREQLLRYLRWILCLLCMYFLASCALAVVASILSPAGAAPGAADVAYGALCLVVAVVPAVFDIFVCLRMLSLLDAAATEEQEGLPDAAARLSKVSCLALSVTAGLTALQYVVQLCLLPYLSEVRASVQLPLMDLFFVVLILLFSRLLIENKRLREDSSLII